MFEGLVDCRIGEPPPIYFVFVCEVIFIATSLILRLVQATTISFPETINYLSICAVPELGKFIITKPNSYQNNPK
jgi:hypothetical protein